MMYNLSSVIFYPGVATILQGTKCVALCPYTPQPSPRANIPNFHMGLARLLSTEGSRESLSIPVAD